MVVVVVVVVVVVDDDVDFVLDVLEWLSPSSPLLLVESLMISGICGCCCTEILNS